MSVLIFSKQDQASGNFNNGEILEKKPIGFLQDGGELKPYSNLFYWADAWTPSFRSTIGLHPHQGFEICSFVIEGSIKHFDSQQNKWIELKKGDAQIIRSGNGISHAEEILDNSTLEMFWFIDKETAYGGRAAIIPLLSAILRVHGKKFNEMSIQESCDIGCKDSLAVFFRSASLITHSRKIKISNL